MSESSEVKDISDATFENEVLKSSTPVLVDFWAAWCGPCKSIAPILSDVAEEFSGQLKVTKLNIDENPSTPSKYSIRGIPHLIFFKDGKVIEQITGAVPKDSLTNTINKVLAS